MLNLYRLSTKDEGDSNELASALKKAKVTGKGVDMVEKITSLLAVEDKYDLQRVGFLQVRIGEAKKRKTYRKPPRPKDGDKNLRFSECPPEIQKGLRNSRAVEWQKWMKFNAGIILEKKELEQMIEEGVPIYPMQWVETDKNAHKRRNKGDYKEVPPKLKSRLVGCGNFENTDGDQQKNSPKVALR